MLRGGGIWGDRVLPFEARALPPSILPPPPAAAFADASAAVTDGDAATPAHCVYASAAAVAAAAALQDACLIFSLAERLLSSAADGRGLERGREQVGQRAPLVSPHFQKSTAATAAAAIAKEQLQLQLQLQQQ